MRMHPERSLFIFGARVSIAAIDVIPSSLNAFAGKASVMSEVTVKITNSISFSVIALLIRISLTSMFADYLALLRNFYLSGLNFFASSK